MLDPAQGRELQFSDTSQGTSASEAIGAALTFGDISATYLSSGLARFALVIRPPAASWGTQPGTLLSTASAMGRQPNDPLVFPGANASLLLDGSVTAIPGFAALSLSGGSGDASDGTQTGRRFQSLVLPFAVVGVAPVYACSPLGDRKLHLSLSTLAGIYMGDITMWDDVRLRMDNPDAAAEGLLPSAGITVLVQSSRSESTRLLTAALGRASPAFLAWMRARLVAVESGGDPQAQADAAAATETDLDFWPQPLLAGNTPGTYVRASGEGQLESLVLNGDLMIGYLQELGEIRAAPASLLVGGDESAGIPPAVVEVGEASLSACIGETEAVNTTVNGTTTSSVQLSSDPAVLDAQTWRLNTAMTTRPRACWPIHGVVYAMVPRLYFSSSITLAQGEAALQRHAASLRASGNTESADAASLATIAGSTPLSCDSGRTAVAVLRWMLDPTVTSVPLKSFGVGTLPQSVLAAASKALQLQVLCDGDPIVP